MVKPIPENIKRKGNLERLERRSQKTGQKKGGTDGMRRPSKSKQRREDRPEIVAEGITREEPGKRKKED